MRAASLPSGIQVGVEACRSRSVRSRRPRPADAHRVVARLHDEQHDRALRPPSHRVRAHESPRVAKRAAEPAQRTRHPPSPVHEDRREETHHARAFRVADRLDVRVGAGMERRADGDALRVVDGAVGCARTDDRLRVRAHEHADLRAAEPRPEEQLQRSEHAGGEHDVLRTEHDTAPAQPGAGVHGVDLPAVAGSAHECRLALWVNDGSTLLGET